MNEWAEFESGLAADVDEWILSNAEDLESVTLRERLDKQRDSWLKGHRGVLGFAYLTLGPLPESLRDDS